MSLPKIKYVIIVLETKKILCEHKEEEIPNIQKVIRNILDNRVKPFDASSLNYDKDFTIFYKNDSLITILCVTDINYPNSTAFEFLNVLVNSFRSQYKEEDIKQAVETLRKGETASVDARSVSSFKLAFVIKCTDELLVRTVVHVAYYDACRVPLGRAFHVLHGLVLVHT